MARLALFALVVCVVVLQANAGGWPSTYSYGWPSYSSGWSPSYYSSGWSPKVYSSGWAPKVYSSGWAPKVYSSGWAPKTYVVKTTYYPSPLEKIIGLKKSLLHGGW
ncbi:Hypothetical predicted protein [Cloeon dipterum]|uniref:Uncharacterized protein n=1 Tax=Cloeon dipterum TaxID=197152 RepID=A0A8S1D8Z7_9INSE|nr:Hypothetical predicted protein [Cloeon dipterum]